MKRLPSSVVDAVVQVYDDVQSLRTPVRSPTKHAGVLKTIVDGQAEDKTSNYQAISTQVVNIILAEYNKDDYNVYNNKHRTSLPCSWAFAGALRFGFCADRVGSAD